ncbi:MAG: NHLP family bacteriocin export ABC transporter peptidase/permease/ATPase subunit [Acidobacteriota bacterium]
MSTPAPELDAAGRETPWPDPPKKRVKTPTVLPMEAVECGAAALRCVLGYHDKWVPLEELRYECGVSRDGSKASNVLKAARKYGMVAKGFKYDSLEKLYELDFPIILFWNFNHFVTLEGFDGEQARIMDPAQGPRKVSMEELDASYSGIVLTFEPGEDFEPSGDPPTMIPGLRRRLEGSEKSLLFVVLCGLLLVIPGLVIPVFTRVFIDQYLVGGQGWLIKPLLWFMAGTLVVHALIEYLQEYYLLRLETSLALGTSAKFFQHILRLPADYFGQRYAGEIGSRVMINDKVAKMIGGKLAATFVDAMMTGFYALLMLFYDVTLTLVVVALSLLNVAVVRAAGKWRADASRRLMQDKGKVTGTAMSGLQMIETLKATGSENEFFGRWAGYHAKTINSEQSLGLISNTVSAIPPFIETLTTVAVLTLGGYKVMTEATFTVGMLIAYQTLLKSFMRPLASFVDFGSQLQELEADMNRLDDVLVYPQDPQYRESDAEESEHFDETVVKLAGKVELRDINFGYNPLEKPLIRDFNLTVQPGERVALVGGSGSGKSTVAKIVSGLYRPWDGELLFDDVPFDEVPRRLKTNSLGVVSQEYFLFDGTVRDNITMWDPTLAPERIRRASVDARIADVIEAREGTYNSWVEGGGGNFSGGQAQRLEIARALSGEPSILILDEATSALDPTTEAEIEEALRRRGCTCVIIAHRLSTIRDCDKIVVMHRGQIVQEGTHDEMKDVDGPYQRLISM